MGLLTKMTRTQSPFFQFPDFRKAVRTVPKRTDVGFWTLLCVAARATRQPATKVGVIFGLTLVFEPRFTPFSSSFVHTANVPGK
jgi:hypothetical protein